MDYYDLKSKNKDEIDKYNVGSNNGKVNFYPRYIQIEHTTKCNAHCIMCNHFYLNNRGCSDINVDHINKIRSILPYCEYIMLNGSGEPFLCKDIDKYIETYLDYGVKIGTNTNFCYIPDNLWDYLKSSFSFINISCDGATKETFELIRSGLNFDTFIDNLKYLSKLAPNLNKNMDCVIMRQNICELYDLVKLAKSYGFKSIRFHDMGVNWYIGNYDDTRDKFNDYATYMLLKVCDYGRENGIHVSVPMNLCNSYNKSNIKNDVEYINNFNLDTLKLRYRDASLKSKHTSLSDDYLREIVNDSDFNENMCKINNYCQWGIERCYIDVNGNVTSCCYNTSKYFGNLNDYDNFDNIWNGNYYCKYRVMMGQHLIPNWCNHCNWIKNPVF